MTNLKDIDNILARHFANEPLSDAELSALEEYRKDNPKDYGQLSSLLGGIREERLVGVDTTAAWEKVEAQLQAEESRPLLRRLYPVLAVAASLLLLVGIGLFAYNNLFGTIEKQFANNLEQKKEISLPDGSRVVLYPYASLAYTESEGARKVELNGDAFFDVTHDGKDFVVESEDLKVEVLGTSFTIGGDLQGNRSVTVSDGRVKVSTHSEEIVLVKGEKVTASDGNLGEKEVLDDNKKVQTFVFDKTPIAEAVKKIEKDMDVRIEMGSGISDNTVTTKLNISAPIDAVRELSLLCNCTYDSISPLHYRIYKK